MSHAVMKAKATYLNKPWPFRAVPRESTHHGRARPGFWHPIVIFDTPFLLGFGCEKYARSRTASQKGRRWSAPLKAGSASDTRVGWPSQSPEPRRVPERFSYFRFTERVSGRETALQHQTCTDTRGCSKREHACPAAFLSPPLWDRLVLTGSGDKMQVPECLLAFSLGGIFARTCTPIV